MAVSDFIPNGGRAALDRLREGRKIGVDTAHEVIADAADRLVDASERISVLARQLGDRAADAYGRARVTAREVDSNLQPFVQERPYVALAIAVGVGFLLARAFASRGPKVIYVEPPPAEPLR
jgi:ElaB/YqjD/DUF883 family membrane-anchored ribosome-binding protein